MWFPSIWMVQGPDDHRANALWTLILDVVVCNISRMIGLNADITFLAMTCHCSYIRFHYHCESAKDIFYDQRRVRWEAERWERERIQLRLQTRALRRYCHLPSTDSDSQDNSHSETN